MQPVVLAREFQRRFKLKYGKYPYSLKTVQEGKWWPFIKEYADNSKLDDEQTKKFIELLFESWNDSDGRIYPFVFSQKIAHDNEEYIIQQSNINEETIGEDEYIQQTLKKISLWGKTNRIYNNVLGRFILDEMNIFKAKRGEYYMPIFFFSKKFISRYGELTDEEILKKNSIRTFNSELYNSLKQSLLDDFID